MGIGYNIKFENCIFNKFEKKIEKEDEKRETIINLIRESKKNYIFDMESFKSIIFNKKIEDLSFLNKYLVLEEGQVISSDIYYYLKEFEIFYINMKYIMDRFSSYINETTIIFNNIKEKKEFFCLMKLIEINYKEVYFYIEKEDKKEDKKEIEKEKKTFELPYLNEMKDIIGSYFLRTKDENNKEIYSSVFDYYYTSDEEKEKFKNNEEIEIQFKYPTDTGVKKIKMKFKIKHSYKDQWDISME